MTNDITLLLHQKTRNVSFHIPETLAHGYSTQLSGMGGHLLTHPSTFFYRGGKIDDFPIETNLVVGVSPRINTSKDLLRTVQYLYDMSLPAPGNFSITAVKVVIGNWFSCKAFLSKVNVQFQLPYNDQGEYLRCNVKLNLVPTGVDRTVSLTSFREGKVFATEGFRPGRDWKFSRQFGVRNVK